MKGSLLYSAGSLILALLFSCTGFGQVQVSDNLVHKNTTKYVDAKDFFDPSSPTSGLQEAVDHLKPEGGTIFLSPGVYKIRKSIRLFSGVTIVGNGESSVIERADSCIQMALSSPGKEGDEEIQVENTAGFEKGGEITIYSNKFEGFNSAVAVIAEVKGKTLKLDRPLRKNYLAENRAGVVNFFPTFTMTNGSNIRIENLVIDGKMKQGINYHGDFVFSAIHLVHVKDVFIDKVIIRRYPGDGFSIQGGSNAFCNELPCRIQPGEWISSWHYRKGKHMDTKYFEV